MASSPLVPCPSCARHVRAHEAVCPFCASTLPADLAERAAPPWPRRRLNRAAVFVFGATLSTAACSGNVVQGVGAGTGGSAGTGGGVSTHGTGGTGGSPVDAGPDGPADDGGPEDAEDDVHQDVNVQPPYGAPPYGLPPPPPDGG